MARQHEPAPTDIWDALRRCMRLPRVWIVVISAAALASAVDVAHEPTGWTVHIRVTTITAVLLAIVWLPALFSVIALTGGKLKAGAGEATTLGLISLFTSLPVGEREKSLSSAIAVFEGVEAQAPASEKPTARGILDQLQGQLASAEAPEETLRRLEAYAVEYEAIRSSMPSSDARTFEMTRLVAKARATASASRLDDLDPNQWFADGSDGRRIIALALVQSFPLRGYFDIAMEALKRPRSPFEQFHALRALDEMLPNLDRSKRARLRAALVDQREGDESRGQWISPSDYSRWALSGDLLSALE